MGLLKSWRIAEEWAGKRGERLHWRRPMAIAISTTAAATIATATATCNRRPQQRLHATLTRNCLAGSGPVGIVHRQNRRRADSGARRHSAPVPQPPIAWTPRKRISYASKRQHTYLPHPLRTACKLINVAAIMPCIALGQVMIASVALSALGRSNISAKRVQTDTRLVEWYDVMGRPELSHLLRHAPPSPLFYTDILFFAYSLLPVSLFTCRTTGSSCCCVWGACSYPPSLSFVGGRTQVYRELLDTWQVGATPSL